MDNMATSKRREGIELASMPQLEEAVNEEDNWTGLTDAAARRKRQNRLAQRAYRKRRALESTEHKSSNSSGLPNQTVNHDEYPQIMSTQVIPIRHPISPPLIPYVTSNNPENLASSARPSLIFPLTQDHLITLIQYNVLRGILTNMSILGLLYTMPSECGNVVYVEPLSLPNSFPPSFAPTPLQLSTPHSPWIDIIPLGRWRDNMISAKGTYDEDELCTDIVGGLFEGFSDCDRRGLVVWNNPWDVRGWEVSEGFVINPFLCLSSFILLQCGSRSAPLCVSSLSALALHQKDGTNSLKWNKWGWLLNGCEELIAATNQWRAVRGEDSITEI